MQIIKIEAGKNVGRLVGVTPKNWKILTYTVLAEYIFQLNVMLKKYLLIFYAPFTCSHFPYCSHF